MHLPLGEHVCREKNTTPALAVFVLHRLKLCLCKAEQTPRKGHKTHSSEFFDLLPTERGNVPPFCSHQLATLALTGII